MSTIIGPLLARNQAYAFDSWSAGKGLMQGFAYRRIEDANYARNAAIHAEQRPLVCATLDAFHSAIAIQSVTAKAA